MTTRRILIAATLATPFMAPGAARANHDTTHGSLTLIHPWTRAARAGGQGAGFMGIRNNGAEADRLVAASSPAAPRMELHTHIRDGDVMRMRPVNDIPVPAGQTVRLQPGGLHLMFIGLSQELHQGQSVPVTLVFERAGPVTLLLEIQAAGARGHGHGHGH